MEIIKGNIDHYKESQYQCHYSTRHRNLFRLYVEILSKGYEKRGGKF